MSNKKDFTSQSMPFEKFEAATKQVLPVSKKDFDKALADRVRRSRKQSSVKPNT